MFKNLMASVLLCLLVIQGFAQADSSSQKVYQYIGVQANQLIRQILNFSNSNQTINNPYLLTYSLNSANSGWGFNVGIGYEYNQFKNDDPTNEQETKINDLFFRIGVERKSQIGKRLIASYGFDFVIDNQKNHTVSTIVTDVVNDLSTTTTTDSKQNGFGFGPHFTLNYALSKNLLLGTEATYYFKSFKTIEETVIKATVFEFDPFTQSNEKVTNTEEEEDTVKSKNIKFNLPVAIFLILRF